MSFNRQLTQQEHVHAFMVLQTVDGWEVCEQEDSVILRHVQHDDWHRVERDAAVFALHARELERQGWVEH